MKKQILSVNIIKNDDFPDTEVGNLTEEVPVRDSTADATNATKVDVKEEPVFDKELII